MTDKSGSDLERVSLRGGKRANLAPAEINDINDGDWWVGYGKSEECQFEGPWVHMAIVAAKILRHPNTQSVAPNLYRPDIKLTRRQETMY